MTEYMPNSYKGCYVIPDWRGYAIIQNATIDYIFCINHCQFRGYKFAFVKVKLLLHTLHLCLTRNLPSLAHFQFVSITKLRVGLNIIYYDNSEDHRKPGVLELC